jgi:hypothetical protein
MKLPGVLIPAIAGGVVLLSSVLGGTALASEGKGTPPPDPFGNRPKIPVVPAPAQPLTPRQLCLAAGFYWSEELEACFRTEESMCVAEGYLWDDHWGMCLRTLDAIECHDQGGLWDEDHHHCIPKEQLENPTVPFPDPNA